MRLRQIALVTTELKQTEKEICEKLDLEVCYRDPGLSHFGLRHGLYAIGDQILEVVAPKRDGTTAGRFLERRGGDGGYMVLLQTVSLEKHKTRIEEAGLRIVHDGKVEQKETSIRGIHLHPKDVGGAILSLDEAEPKESWLWAGEDWQYHATSTLVSRISAITMQANDPDKMAEMWSAATGLDATDRVIELDDAQIRFVPAIEGRGDGLASADLETSDRSLAGQTIHVCGFNFFLV